MTEGFAHTIETVVEWNYELHYERNEGWRLIPDPCPECGNQDVWNATLEQGCQFVGYDTTDKGKSSCGIDDSWGVELSYCSCGECGFTLTD